MEEERRRRRGGEEEERKRIGAGEEHEGGCGLSFDMPPYLSRRIWLEFRYAPFSGAGAQ